MTDKINPIDVQIGKAIRSSRTLNQISQTELGHRVGVTFQQIQKYENGTNRISTSKLIELARALRVDVRSLLEGFAPDSGLIDRKPPSREEISNSREAVLLNNAFFAIRDKETRKYILKIVQRLATADPEIEKPKRKARQQK